MAIMTTLVAVNATERRRRTPALACIGSSPLDDVPSGTLTSRIGAVDGVCPGARATTPEAGPWAAASLVVADVDPPYKVILASTTGRPVGICQDDEPPPRCFLDPPQHRRTAAERLLLPGIGVGHGESQRGRTRQEAGGKDPPFVVAPVVAMQDDAARGVPDDDDDLVLVEHRQPEHRRVETSGLEEIRHIEDHALELFHAHRTDPKATLDDTSAQ